MDFLTNQQLVMPYYQAYREVRNSIHSRLGSGPVETLRYVLPKDSSDWNEVIFVSEKQVIEELATGTLTRGFGTKFIANFTQLMSRAFGKKKASGDYSKEEVIRCERMKLRSPGALGRRIGRTI